MAKLFKAKLEGVPQIEPKVAGSAGLGDKIENTFTRLSQKLAHWGWDFVGELFVNIFDYSMKILKPGMVRMFKPFTDDLLKQPGIPENIKQMITRTMAEEGEAAVIGIGVIAVAAGYQLLGAALTPLSNQVTHAVAQVSPYQIIDPGTLARALIRGVVSRDWYDGVMRSHGYEKANAETILTMSENHAPVGELIEFLRRGTVNEPEFELGLKRLGYPQFYNDLYKDLKYQTPPVNDLIRFMVREAFDDAAIAKFGYGNDYPTEIDKYLPKVGLTPEWGKRYWYAHWTLPSPTQGYEMMHRGIITEAELDALLKTADYPTFWRDKLMKMSYNVLTRVDVRRLRQAGLIDRAKVKKTYLEMGYKEEDAELLTEFAEQGITQDEKDTTRADVVNSYATALIDRTSAQTALVKMGYDGQEADVILKLTDAQIAKADREEKIVQVQELYAAGKVDKMSASTQLAQSGLKQASIDRALAGADHVVKVNEKIPSASDARRFFIRGLMDEVAYRSNLKQNGYNDASIDLYVKDATIDRGKNVQA